MSHGPVALSEDLAQQWGTTVVPTVVHGTTFRMYAERPHRLESLLEMATRWGDRPHIVQGDRVTTFQELRSLVTARQREFEAANIGAGHRVVIVGFNSPEWIVNFWAVVRAGAVAVLGNAWWTAAEFDDALEEVAPAAVLADERSAARLGDHWRLLPWRAESISAPSNAAAPFGSPEHDSGRTEDDPAAVIFTSGTSGRPKAAVLTHRSFLAGLQMLLSITRRLPHQVDGATGESALHTGPMFHVGGVQVLLRAICVGDTLVMPTGRFEPGEALELIEKWRIRRWSAVPTMITRVLEHPDIARRDLSSLRSITPGGAPVHADFIERMRTGFPGAQLRIATGYGLTENGGQAVAASDADTTSRPGTVGRPLPCVEVITADPTDYDDGEILLRSPTQMAGYLGEAESPIDDAGWLHTGDLGRIDADGYLWITGRSKDMIIRGGENIAPAAVEAALVRLPAVRDAVVFGLPDPDLGEEVAAAVVLHEPSDEVDLAQQLRGALAAYAVPSRWFIHADPFPVTDSGKTDKKTIVAQARAKVDPS